MPRTTKTRTNKPNSKARRSERGSKSLKAGSMTENTTQDTEPTEGKRRPGAPRKNRNSIRHGMQSGMLPKNCRYIEVRLNVFRRTIEDALLKSKGEISIVDAARINSAVKWEKMGMLATRWIRIEGDNLKPLDKLKFAEAVAKASDNRDRALKELGLDAKPRNPWEIDVEASDND